MATVSATNLLARLDNEQRAAAVPPDGPAQVIAPAGSGKTATLVARIGVLLGRGVPAANILVVTFNRDAASELSRRIQSGLGVMPGGMDGPDVRTLHALARLIVMDAGNPVRLVADRLPLLRHARRSVLARLTADASLPPAEELDGVLSTAILEGRSHPPPISDVVEAYRVLLASGGRHRLRRSPGPGPGDPAPRRAHASPLAGTLPTRPGGRRKRSN